MADKDRDLPTLGLRFVKRVPFQSYNFIRVSENRASCSPSRPPPPSPLPPPPPPVCICERPLSEVVCKQCQTRFKGRVRQKCPLDQQTFLMDHSACPQPDCGAGVESLQEITASSHR